MNEAITALINDRGFQFLFGSACLIFLVTKVLETPEVHEESEAEKVGKLFLKLFGRK